MSKISIFNRSFCQSEAVKSTLKEELHFVNLSLRTYTKSQAYLSPQLGCHVTDGSRRLANNGMEALLRTALPPSLFFTTRIVMTRIPIMTKARDKPEMLRQTQTFYSVGCGKPRLHTCKAP